MTEDVKGFRSLIVWQKAFELTKAVYVGLSDCRDYSFRDQTQRACVSIMNNIAEGSARGSDKAFCNFCNIARGSAAEVESLIILGQELGYFQGNNTDKLLRDVDEVSKLLTGLIKKLNARGS